MIDFNTSAKEALWLMGIFSLKAHWEEYVSAPNTRNMPPLFTERLFILLEWAFAV